MCVHTATPVSSCPFCLEKEFDNKSLIFKELLASLPSPLDPTTVLLWLDWMSKQSIHDLKATESLCTVLEIMSSESHACSLQACHVLNDIVLESDERVSILLEISKNWRLIPKILESTCPQVLINVLALMRAMVAVKIVREAISDDTCANMWKTLSNIVVNDANMDCCGESPQRSKDRVRESISEYLLAEAIAGNGLKLLSDADIVTVWRSMLTPQVREAYPESVEFERSAMAISISLGMPVSWGWNESEGMSRSVQIMIDSGLMSHCSELLETVFNDPTPLLQQQIMDTRYIVTMYGAKKSLSPDDLASITSSRRRGVQWLFDVCNHDPAFTPIAHQIAPKIAPDVWEGKQYERLGAIMHADHLCPPAFVSCLMLIKSHEEDRIRIMKDMVSLGYDHFKSRELRVAEWYFATILRLAGSGTLSSPWEYGTVFKRARSGCFQCAGILGHKLPDFLAPPPSMGSSLVGSGPKSGAKTAKVNLDPWEGWTVRVGITIGAIAILVWQMYRL